MGSSGTPWNRNDPGGSMNWHLLAGLFCLVLVTALIRFKFGSLLNVIFLSFAIEFALRTLLGYFAYYYFFPDQLTDLKFLDQALLLAIVYAFSYAAGFVLPKSWLKRILKRIGATSIKASNRAVQSLGTKAALVILALGIVAFIMMATIGGGGLLWLTNTRDAYLTYRSGVGILWSTYASAITLALLVYLHTRKGPIGLPTLIPVPFLVILAYFTGSKQTILALALGVLVYWTHRVHSISSFKAFATLALLLVAFLATTILQGSFKSAPEAISYFDYLNATARYIENRDSLSGLSGSGIISYFWSFVPRFLVSTKPFEYGPVLISSYLYPGAAVEGYTPAYLEWTLAHLDWGVAGVVAQGLMKGQLLGSVQEVYLKAPTNLFFFLLACHLGFSAFNLPGGYELGFLLSFLVGWAMKRSMSLRSAQPGR